MAGDLNGLVAVCSLQEMAYAQLNEEQQRIAGLVVPHEEGLSKRQSIEQVLANLTQEQLAQLALKFGVDRRDIPLDEAGRKILEAKDPPLTTSHDKTSHAPSEPIWPASAVSVVDPRI